MKIADFVIVAVVIVALAAAIWYTRRNKKNSYECDGNCFSCSQDCGLDQKKRGKKHED